MSNISFTGLAIVPSKTVDKISRPFYASGAPGVVDTVMLTYGIGSQHTSVNNQRILVLFGNDVTLFGDFWKKNKDAISIKGLPASLWNRDKDGYRKRVFAEKLAEILKIEHLITDVDIAKFVKRKGVFGKNLLTLEKLQEVLKTLL